MHSRGRTFNTLLEMPTPAQPLGRGLPSAFFFQYSIRDASVSWRIMGSGVMVVFQYSIRDAPPVGDTSLLGRQVSLLSILY